MKKRKKLTDKLKDSVLATGEFYVKFFLTIFIVALYIVLFFNLDGFIFFETTKYCNSFEKNPFQLHIIDVENGDAFFIKLPSGQTLMIDTGDEAYSSRVCSYIKQYKYFEGLKSIDYLLLTHPDSDHVGGAAEIIEKYNVKTLLRPKLYSLYESENYLIDESKNYLVSEGEDYSKVIETAYKHKCKMIFCEKDIKFNPDSNTSIEFLSPDLDYYSNSNNYSGVVMMTVYGKKFLFTGDASTSIEKTLIENYGNYLKADVLKLGHHGSYSSTSQEFLNYVKPQYAILSCSERSSILPSEKIISRLKDNNIKILSTAKLGNFALSIIDNTIIYHKADKGANHLVLILAIFLFVIFIVWKNPFKRKKPYLCN